MTSLRVGPEGVSTEQLVEQMEDQMDNRQDEMGSAKIRGGSVNRCQCRIRMVVVVVVVTATVVVG